MALLETREAYHPAARCLAHGSCGWGQVCSLVTCGGAQATWRSQQEWPKSDIQEEHRLSFERKPILGQGQSPNIVYIRWLEILPGIYLKEMIMNMISLSYTDRNSSFTHKCKMSQTLKWYEIHQGATMVSANMSLNGWHSGGGGGHYFWKARG